jgi:hypothetical protein
MRLMCFMCYKVGLVSHVSEYCLNGLVLYTHIDEFFINFKFISCKLVLGSCNFCSYNLLFGCMPMLWS